MSRTSAIERRPLWPLTVILIGLLAFAAFQAALVGNVSAQETDATPETEIGVLEARDGLPECEPVEVGGTPTGISAASSYQIVSEESAARYISTEELASVGTNEAIGETNAIIGQIMFDEDGLPLACSRFDVDLRTLQSDEARRDNFLYNNTLETETYPLATFVLRAVDGLEGSLPNGEATAVTLVGDLTFHGVTQLVAWEATVTVDGDSLTGSATTSFAMPEFDIEPPIVGPVVSIDEVVTLEVDITASPAA